MERGGVRSTQAWVFLRAARRRGIAVALLAFGEPEPEPESACESESLRVRESGLSLAAAGCVPFGRQNTTRYTPPAAAPLLQSLCAHTLMLSSFLSFLLLPSVLCPQSIALVFWPRCWFFNVSSGFALCILFCGIQGAQSRLTTPSPN